MTIPIEEFKARLLADPLIRAEDDALAREFDISIKLVKAQQRGPVSAPGASRKQ
jgi:hypothetical protein